jgi:hypothetical protein
LSFEAVAYRATAYETPLWAFPNLEDGRYNRAGGRATQYFGLHPMAPWAEQLRCLNRRTADQAREMRIGIWAMRIALDDDPVALTFDDVGRYGLDAADLVSDDHAACRALAEALYADGARSILAPSAALPGATSLVVLEPAAIIDYHAEPIDSEDCPAALLAQHGRCPENLWNHVHFRGPGTSHAALEAWQAGDDYVFEQPEVTKDTLAIV